MFTYKVLFFNILKFRKVLYTKFANHKFNRNRDEYF